ncbi:Os01g0535650 [Oryza sativa Japonica Group]|uniref:Os01g0535650 protein n=1 Tax=Oryza sativa subsp. japonica TaxID=39947 RepID=A0A0P0V3R5_ORYSJ|nr:hypothetical protein EE612_003236 [Oryza sativa]BAS72540.1 Os01g0535650 [Oryza sativa Japonica Group]
MVTSFTLHSSRSIADDASPFLTLTLKYAGCLGTGRLTPSLLSIATTSDMVGRSAAFSCTHSNAMLTHFIISGASTRQSVNRTTSMSLSHLPSVHSCQACKNARSELTHEPGFLFPLTISRVRTPKLNTSDLTEKRPSEAYSGAINMCLLCTRHPFCVSFNIIRAEYFS